MTTTKIKIEDALHLELTFGNDNHLSLILRKRLTKSEADYLKSVFLLSLESTVDEQEAQNDNPK